jgi:hypothetical protein
VSNWFGNKRIRYKKNIVKESLTPGFNVWIYPKEVGQQEIHYFILFIYFIFLEFFCLLMEESGSVQFIKDPDLRGPKNTPTDPDPLTLLNPDPIRIRIRNPGQICVLLGSGRGEHVRGKGGGRLPHTRRLSRQATST